MKQEFTTIVNLTPAGARKLLDEAPADSRNRALNEARVAWLASQITEGCWRLNGEAIVIGKDGSILDGQHRLHAVIRADKAIRVVIVRDVDPAVFHTIDTGKPRSMGDVFTIAGERHATAKAAVAKLMWNLMQRPDNCPIFCSGWGGQRVTNQKALEVLKRHPRLDEVAAENYSFSKVGPPSLLLFVRYLSMLVDEEKSRVFFNGLVEGTDLRKGYPIHTLRERLFAARAMPNMRLTPEALLALVIRAWNSHYRGRPLKKLDVRLVRKTGRENKENKEGKERFPTIDGLTAAMLSGVDPE